MLIDLTFNQVVFYLKLLIRLKWTTYIELYYLKIYWL